MKRLKFLAAVAAMSLAACANAAGFAGKWIGMTHGDLLSIRETTPGQYLALTQNRTPIYFEAKGTRLVGTVNHLAPLKVDAVMVDGNHLRLLTKLFGLAQEYRRKGR